MVDKPNILFIHIDNISQGDLGCYGGAFQLGAVTPNMDAFADEGLRLTNYNVEAQCTPTRAALLTGRYSARTGCSSVMPGLGLVSWETTIADCLRDAGYRNAIFGKWHVGEGEGRYPTDKGFDYWYGINGTWDTAMWPEDPWFIKEGDLEPEHVIESEGAGEISSLQVLNAEVRRGIDVEFLEKANHWMEDAVDAGEPFFVYFNHSSIHFPILPRADWEGSSNGGPVGDILQQLDADVGSLLDKIDQLGIKDDTIVIVAGDNGRDTTFHGPNNRSARGPWRGGYFSTYEGNNRTVCMIRWPDRLRTGTSDEMIHVVDWLPTLMNLIDNPEAIPADRILDGVDQSEWLRGDKDESDRNHFHMFFGTTHVGMRYKNFKVLTHHVEDGTSPILELATPHVYNLTVNPDEDTPYNYGQVHSWVLMKRYLPMTQELRESLAKDSVPPGADLDYNPYGPRSPADG